MLRNINPDFNNLVHVRRIQFCLINEYVLLLISNEDFLLNQSIFFNFKFESIPVPYILSLFILVSMILLKKEILLSNETLYSKDYKLSHFQTIIFEDHGAVSIMYSRYLLVEFQEHRVTYILIQYTMIR